MSLDYIELALTFIFGIITGIIVQYIRHSFSVKRSKNKRYLPYLTKMHSVVARIMKERRATELNRTCDRLFNIEKFKEKISKLTLKELWRKKLIQYLNNPAWALSVDLVESYNSLITTIKECGSFEKIYAEMDKVGLISAIEVNDQNLYRYLSWFHRSTSSILKDTEDILESCVESEKFSYEQGAEKIVNSPHFKMMLKLYLLTRDLFWYGSDLKKRLEKLV